MKKLLITICLLSLYGCNNHSHKTANKPIIAVKNQPVVVDTEMIVLNILLRKMSTMADLCQYNSQYNENKVDYYQTANIKYLKAGNLALKKYNETGHLYLREIDTLVNKYHQKLSKIDMDQLKSK
jgi:hypothetical protein